MKRWRVVMAWTVLAWCGALQFGCGQPLPPTQVADRASDSSAKRGATADSRPTATVPAAPLTRAAAICGVGASVSEVSDEILSRSGRGLLWLAAPELPDAADDGAVLRLRGAEEVRSARALADCLLSHHAPSFDPEQSEGFEHFQHWLDTHFGPEHAETLLATGTAYFASLMVAESAIDAFFDLPTARLLLERATAADPQLADGLGPLILGAYLCLIPREMGGSIEDGLTMLQTKVARGGPLELPSKVAAAELCAYGKQDRALFDRLIAEVLTANPGGGAFALVAQLRASQLQEQADEMFLPDP